MAKNAEKETALYEAVFRLLARGEKMYSVTVQQIADGGKDFEVTVNFDRVGVKKMFASFAKLVKC